MEQKQNSHLQELWLNAQSNVMHNTARPQIYKGANALTVEKNGTPTAQKFKKKKAEVTRKTMPISMKAISQRRSASDWDDMNSMEENQEFKKKINIGLVKFEQEANLDSPTKSNKLNPLVQIQIPISKRDSLKFVMPTGAFETQMSNSILKIQKSTVDNL